MSLRNDPHTFSFNLLNGAPITLYMLKIYGLEFKEAPYFFSKKLNKELHMLFFHDIYDLHETKRFILLNQLMLLWQPSRFNMAAKFNFQQITFKKVR